MIEKDFPGPAKRPVEPEFDVESHLQPLMDQVSEERPQATDERLLGLDVRGHGGGQWQLIVRGEQIVGLEIGNHDDRQATFRLDVATFAALAHGAITWNDALRSGSAEISGNGRPTSRYSQILEQIVAIPVSSQ